VPDSGRFIALSRPVVTGKELGYIRECLDAGWLSSGAPAVSLFEERIAEYVGASTAVACTNGTAALHTALIVADVGPGDLVLVPSLTFIAPVNAVRYTGADPVFLGCDSYANLDPEIVQSYCEKECRWSEQGLVEQQSGRRVKAVLPVHVFGNPCSLSPLLEIARRFHLTVIEDATESLGSRWRGGDLDGRSTGTAGDFGAYSFNGNKIITTGGGGMIVGRESARIERARHLTTQAKADPIRYVHDEVGFNYRMNAITAATGLAQLEALPHFIRARAEQHRLYTELLNDVRGLTILGTPPDTAPNHWLHTLLVEPQEFGIDREQLMHQLSKAGIETRPVWYPNHLQAPYKNCRAYRVDSAVWFWERGLNLPSSSDLTEDDVQFVSQAIIRARA
jgi:perosamine synthetase